MYWINRFAGFSIYYWVCFNSTEGGIPQVYAAIAEDVSDEFTFLEFWKNNWKELPKSGEASSQILLCQPSSAATEHIFSIMNNSFEDQHHSSLEDYLEASVMMQYNKVNNI